MRGLVLALLLLPAAAQAGPWTHELGRGYFKGWVSVLPGAGWFDEVGEAPELYGYYQELFVGTYAELGVAPRLDATVHWTPLRTFLLVDAVEAPTFAASVGEPAVGLKWQPVQAGRFALAVEGRLRFPTTSNAPVATIHAVDDGEPIAELRTASGVFEAELGLSLGLGFDRLYLAGGVSAIRRSAGFDSVLVWSIEAGTDLGPNRATSVRIRIGGRHGLRDGSAAYHRSPSGLGNGTEYVAFTLELDRRIAEAWWFGVSLGGGLGPVVRQTGGPQLGFSLSTVF